MFKWIIKQFLNEFKDEIGKEYVKELFFEVLNDEEVQKGLLAFTDDLYKRYSLKVLSTIGGMQKGINAQEEGMLDIIDSKGHFSLKKILPSLIKGFFSKGEQKSSDLP